VKYAPAAGRTVTFLFLAVFFTARIHAESEKAPTPTPKPKPKPMPMPAPAPIAVVEPPAPEKYGRPAALVNADELLKLLSEAKTDLLLIDARAAEAYEAGHLPGAQNIASDFLQDTGRPPYFMPAPESFKKTCADAGIHANSRIIVYDADDGRLAARVWFTLHAYGHTNVAILNGGVGGWKQAGRPWSDAALEPPKPGTFEPSETLRGVCTFAELAQFRVRVHDMGKLPPTTLIDARSLKEYSGEQTRGKLGGHIPGAANIEWSAMMSGKETDRVWRTPQEIHAILRLAGVERAEKIAVYDQAGGRSAHMCFTLWLMGFEQVSNYVAGWREYGNRDDVEFEK
jgi:3-mercaptopyruvate sulfurtransferase SseA